MSNMLSIFLPFFTFYAVLPSTMCGSYVYSDLVGYQTSDIRLLWTITPNPPPPPPQHPFYPPPPCQTSPPPPCPPQYQTCPIVTTPLRCRSRLWSRP